MTSFNRRVWITTMVMGITIAVAGFHHELFEKLRGPDDRSRRTEKIDILEWAARSILKHQAGMEEV